MQQAGTAKGYAQGLAFYYIATMSHAAIELGGSSRFRDRKAECRQSLDKAAVTLEPVDTPDAQGLLTHVYGTAIGLDPMEGFQLECKAKELLEGALARENAPYFLETSEVAQLAVVQLQADPPAAGVVASGLPGRSVEVSGVDGGRAREMLESPLWKVAWVVSDGDMTETTGEPHPRQRQIRGWFALLHPTDS